MVGAVRVQDHWDFGIHLGVPMDDLTKLQEHKAGNSSDMYRILECWSRRIVNQGEKTWNHILDALKKIGENVLATDIEKELGVLCLSI